MPKHFTAEIINANCSRNLCVNLWKMWFIYTNIY